jgi:hypothetical protein
MSTAAAPLVPPMFTGLVDDAAIFPPGNAPMPEAVAAHASHRTSWYADLVGPFVCSDTRLPELQQAREQAGDASVLRVSLTVTGGAGAIEPALTWLGRDPSLELAAVEIALRDEDDLAHNAARVVTVLADQLPDSAEAYLELPRLRSSDVPAGWAAALDEVAASGHRVKYRTGGADAAAFPSAAELAVVLDACIEREVAFKCTAGLHHAVAHVDTDTGFAHHGFLNVLLATRAALDSVPVPEVAELLDTDDATRTAARVRDVGADGIVSARRWFRSFGSCSIAEPRDDLVALDLMTGDDR